MAEKKAMKLNYKLTFLIGFGFMASSIAWAIYDPYTTLILKDKLSAIPGIADFSLKIQNAVPWLFNVLNTQTEAELENSTAIPAIIPLLIGIIMTFDNIFGVIFQPFFGKLSDRTHTRIGKRKPYILIGAPLSALFFALIPHMESIATLMLCVIMYNFIMSTWRSPVVALMPDMTPTELRSEGNGIINLTGGIGTLIGMLSGTALLFIFPNIKGDVKLERAGVFLVGAIVMLISTIVIAFFVKEPDSRLKKVANERMNEQIQNDKKAKKVKMKHINISKPERRSLYFMLACLFFLFAGTNSVQTFFALFAEEQLGKTGSQATFMLAFFAGSLMLAAVPAGFIGKRIGRKKTIVIGFAGLISMFGLYAITHASYLVWVALIVGGICDALININTLPIVLEIGGNERIGTFTGYYYTATFSAQILAPILYGFIRMFSVSYMSLFIFCPLAFTISLLCVLQVKHGEAGTMEEALAEQA